MGNEVACTARHGGASGTGKAYLETEELTFRGEIRFKIPFAGLQRVEAINGVLHLDDTELDLGSEAAKWAEKIKNPKSRVEKMGIKPNSKIKLVGTLEFPEISSTHDDDLDLLVAGVDHLTQLDFQAWKALIKPDGAIWVVRPKGRPEISERDVMAAGHAAGLVDVKVAKFSATHTAEKYVIPKAARPKP